MTNGSVWRNETKTEVNHTRSLTIANGVTSINGWIYIFTVVGGVGLYAASLIPFAGEFSL